MSATEPLQPRPDTVPELCETALNYALQAEHYQREQIRMTHSPVMVRDAYMYSYLWLSEAADKIWTLMRHASVAEVLPDTQTPTGVES